MVTGGVATYVSRTTVRSRPRNSPKSSRSTNTATASIPSIPPGKLRVVVVVVETSVAVLVIVPFASVVAGAGAAWFVAVGVVGAAFWASAPTPAAPVGVWVVGF